MTEATRPSSLLRALGPAVASALPPGRAGLPAQAIVLAVTDAAARQVSPRGISLVAITPDDGEAFTPAKQAVTRAVPTVVWVVVWLLLGRALAKVPLARPVRALLLAGAVYALDVVSVGMGERALAARAAAQVESAGSTTAETATGEPVFGEDTAVG